VGPIKHQDEDEYDVGSLTTSESKAAEAKPMADLVVAEKEYQYTQGKPTRIVIRARITHD
jgi:hypothetical protein